MEFKRTKTIEITVFELESNRADDPQYFKVVWTSSDRNITNQVQCFQADNDLDRVEADLYRSLAKAATIPGIPTVKKSIELLETLLHK